MEEIVAWSHDPPTALRLNAATFEADLWGVIAMEASEGSKYRFVDTPDSSLAVLLQPGFSDNGEEIRRALPGYSKRLIAGLRRRAWQSHVGNTDMLQPGTAAADGRGVQPLLKPQSPKTQKS